MSGPLSDEAPSRFGLEELATIVAARASAADGSSYTASLVAKGQRQAAKKLGEEAVETVIAAVEGDPAHLTAEAADLLYHLLVVLEIGRVPLADVMAELRRRTAQTGLQEKAARKPG